MKKAMIVLSGGMDSTTALGWAKAQTDLDVVGAVHFQYGSKHNGKEIFAAQDVALFYNIPLTTIPLAFMNQYFKSDLLNSGGEIPEGHYADESMKRTVVPFRNGIMLAIACGLAESFGAEVVILGNHYGDHAIYPDCRADFVAAMEEAMKLGTYAHIQLLSPFCLMDKTGIARVGNEHHVPFTLTWTCYKGGDVHCGVCGSCTERKEAFRMSGVEDPTVYAE